MTQPRVRITLWSVLLAGVLGLAGPGVAPAQTGSGDAGALGIPPSPSLGIAPGTLDASEFDAGPGVIGGQMRKGIGRIPRHRQSRSPGAPTSLRSGRGVLELPALPDIDDDTGRPFAAAIVPGDDPGAIDEGPLDGLTLDAAIQRLTSANLDLAALRSELPLADAEILTASLRSNPILYGDAQMIPYGAYSASHPGGPVQYDIGITWPLDVTRKRQARVHVARVARRSLEAQFQDAVRRQIGELGRAFLALQEAWITADDAQQQVEQLRADLLEAKPEGRSDLLVELEAAHLALDEAHSDLGDARDTLGLLLNLTPEEAAELVPRGPLRGLAPPPPPVEEICRVALGCRPDVIASRIGLHRAQAECGLAHASRQDDWYLFYNPWTYQDQRPYKTGSTSSWALGLTVPIPVFNRNQGNIQRARINLSQAQTELAATERRVLAEVRLAHREYLAARIAVTRLERALKLAPKPAEEDDDAQDAADKRLADYRSALLRQRRAQLELNTAVGLRLYP